MTYHPFTSDEARTNVIGLGLAVTAFGNSLYQQSRQGFGFSGSGVDAVLSAWVLLGYGAAVLALVSVLTRHSCMGYRIVGAYFITYAALSLLHGGSSLLNFGTFVLYFGFAIVGYGAWFVSRERAGL
jgi:hypothetical protein